MTSHKHLWATRYLGCEGTNIACGMKCACGLILRQSEVLDIVNGTDLAKFGYPLEPCPFCGEAQMIRIGEDVKLGIWHVHCQRCQAQTGPCIQKAHAIDAWNRRESVGVKNMLHRS